MGLSLKQYILNWAKANCWAYGNSQLLCRSCMSMSVQHNSSVNWTSPKPEKLALKHALKNFDYKPIFKKQNKFLRCQFSDCEAVYDTVNLHERTGSWKQMQPFFFYNWKCSHSCFQGKYYFSLSLWRERINLNGSNQSQWVWKKTALTNSPNIINDYSHDIFPKLLGCFNTCSVFLSQEHLFQQLSSFLYKSDSLWSEDSSRSRRKIMKYNKNTCVF